MRHIFPGTKPGKYCIGRGQCVRVFYNIHKKTVTCNEVEKEESIFTIMQRIVLPPGFFIAKISDSYVTFGSLTNHLLNGVNVLKQINMFESGEWSLCIGQSAVDLDHINITNNYKRTMDGVLVVLRMIKNIDICQGRMKDELSNIKHDDKTIFTEQWSRVGEEQSINIRVRSNKCLRILQFNSRKACCRRCQIELMRDARKKKDVLVDLPVPNFGANKESIETIKSNNFKTVTNHSVHDENNISIPNEMQEPESSNQEHDPESNTQVHESVSNELTLCESDNRDMLNIIDTIFPGANSQMKTLLTNQKLNLERPKMGRRWDKEVIRICLTLWSRSPHVYRTLRDKGFLILPSGRLLQYYKSSAKQQTGFSDDILQWMHTEAKSKNIPPQGMSGGIVIDEMSIQDDLQIEYTKEGSKLVGLVDLGDENTSMDMILNKSHHRPMASHVLQLIFLGHTGFRFPFCYFPTNEANSASIYVNVWKAIGKLEEWGFKTEYVCMDGGSTNRSFLKMHFDDPIKENYVTKNICTLDGNVVLLMDPKHLGKKLRNNCLASGTGPGHKRCINYKGDKIMWRHWIAAYEWDRSVNAFPIHHKLSDDHLYLTSQLKMRNHLAEQTLDKEMLHLMECFKKSHDNGGSYLNGTIEFLKKTSKLISNYSDSRPITCISDVRLIENKEIYNWFKDWETEVKNTPGLSDAEKNYMLLSYQTREDLDSYLLGFHQICKIHIAQTNWSVIPSMVNSDIIENIFCQARGLCNGANTNPTFRMYKSSMSNVILGESVKSRKSNAGLQSADPLCFNKAKPLNPPKKMKHFR